MLRSRRFSSPALSMLLALAALPAHAQSRVEGVAPDLQIAGGIGVGLGRKLDNSFVTRLRIGALYAFEPYWIDAGATFELGGLAKLAAGGEVSINRWNGFFAYAGLNYAKHERVTTHLAAGFMIFALEWQHAFDPPKPVDALLLTVRVPLGFWWFTSGREERPFAPSAPPEAAETDARPVGPRPLGPSQPSAAGDPSTAALDPEPQHRAREALAEAALAEARGDHSATAEALRRAHAVDPDPMLWLRIADADLAGGKRALAAEDLQRFLASASSPEALALQPSVDARLNQLLAQLARLRLSLEGATGGERVEIDRVARPGAALGYDVLLEPGPHVLVVLRGDQPLVERSFEANAGEIVRLTLPLPAAETQPGR